MSFLSRGYNFRTNFTDTECQAGDSSVNMLGTGPNFTLIVSVKPLSFFALFPVATNFIASLTLVGVLFMNAWKVLHSITFNGQSDVSYFPTKSKMDCKRFLQGKKLAFAESKTI